jgi:hypothetical protein
MGENCRSDPLRVAVLIQLIVLTRRYFDRFCQHVEALIFGWVIADTLIYSQCEFKVSFPVLFSLNQLFVRGFEFDRRRCSAYWLGNAGRSKPDLLPDELVRRAGKQDEGGNLDDVLFGGKKPMMHTNSSEKHLRVFLWYQD